MRHYFTVDTGPLIALLDKSDTWHQWSVAQWSNAEPPLLTCSAVIAESCHLLQRVHHGKEAIFQGLGPRPMPSTNILSQHGLMLRWNLLGEQFQQLGSRESTIGITQR